MFYHLFTFLQDTFGRFFGSALWQYIAFRSIISAIFAILFSMWFGKRFIAYLKSHNISETQRDEKLDPFNTKKVGVPTMGGVVIIVSILLPCLLFGNLKNVYMLLMIATTLILGLLGFLDDYIKTFRHNKDGLNGWYKIIGQVTLGLLVGLTLRYSPQAVMNETVTVSNQVVIANDGKLSTKEVVLKSPTIKSTRTTMPFFKNHNANYADVFFFLKEPYRYWFGWGLFVFMVVFVVAAVSNGANLNDGMDGMAAGNSSVMAVVLLILAYMSSSYVWADYFDIMYIPHAEELVVFLAATIGALIGFLWYNTYPAQIFMGDTGSLTIGGIIAVSACIIHKEILIPLICGVWLMESVSVIGQRFFYKAGKKKGVHQRLWKRTPLHDHFRTSLEQVQKLDPGSTVKFKGSTELYHENKITIRFVIISIILGAFAILTLKIR